MREGQERRPTERRVRVRCETWQSFVDLHAKNISRGGMFLRTDQPGAVGSPVVVELCLPDGRTVRLQAEVAHVVASEDSAQKGRPAGMGVRFVAAAADAVLDMELLLREARHAGEQHPSAPRPAAHDTPSGDADFEDPDLLDALESYVATLRGHDPLHAIGLDPGAAPEEVGERLVTLAERFAPEWYVDRSPEVRAAAAEVTLALGDLRRILAADQGASATGEGESSGLSAGQLFGDLEFLEERSLTADLSVPVSVSAHEAADWIRTGLALLRNCRYREAGEMLRRAMEADPANRECRRDCHLALGHELREAGRLEEAARSFDKALRADPQCAEAAAQLESLSDPKRDGGGRSAILGRLLRK